MFFPVVLDSQFDIFACDEFFFDRLIDFDDILMLTYREMMKTDFLSMNYLFTSYKWIQVDEVQDLNPLQLAIIEKMNCHLNISL